MTAFAVEIPMEKLATYDELMFEMADTLAREVAMRNNCALYFERVLNRDVVLVSGTKVPSEVVTYFAALAQGHPLHDIIAKLEELVSD